jgi:aryl-alcohol dehydrogenase-like predicted oxidoreductase
MGTSETLDTGDIEAARKVVDAALASHSTLFDSSPMYGAAERVLGACLDGRRADAIVATKVWTDDDATAERQTDASLGFYDGHLELLQVHNLVAWPARLDQLEARRDRGQITLIGATHWQPSAFSELEVVMRTGRVDTIQVPYNPVEREVEERILPLAIDLGIGVLVMRPFAKAALLGRTQDRAQLSVLDGTGIRTMAQALLAWGLSHPAISSSIPATSRPERAVENAAAGEVPTLDDEQRALIAGWFSA